jgi:hypothetical protein
MRHEGRKGVKDLGGGRPRYLRKQDLMKLQLESTGNVIKTYRKITELEIAKRIARSTVGLGRMMDRTLWRVDPLRNGKKELHTEQEPVL